VGGDVAGRFSSSSLMLAWVKERVFRLEVENAFFWRCVEDWWLLLLVVLVGFVPAVA